MTSKAVPWSSWLLTVAALLLACGTLLPAAAQDAAASATSSPSNVTTSTSSPSNATAGPMPAYANASLPAFQAVRACVPFTLLLQPNKNLTAGSNDSSTGGFIDFTADDAVINATRVTVSGGVLAVSLRQGFDSGNPITLTLNVNDPSALRLVQNTGSGSVVLGPGFSPPSLTVLTSAVGDVLAYNINATRVAITAQGTSTVQLLGNIQDAAVSAGGTSRVYLLGNVSGATTTALSGLASLFVQGGPDHKLTGSAEGLSRAIYIGGSCDIGDQAPTLLFPSLLPTSSLFGAKCNTGSAADAPVFTPTWSCGLTVDGSSSCEGGQPTAGGEPRYMPFKVSKAMATADSQAAAAAAAAPAPPPPPFTSTAGGVPAGASSGAPSTWQYISGQAGGSSGVIGTGATSTPGGSATSSGTVSGTGLPTTTQTTTSQGGGPPGSTTSISGPPSVASAGQAPGTIITGGPSAGAAAANGGPRDVRLVVPNQPADSYAPVAELEQRAAKVSSTSTSSATSSGPQQQSSSVTSSSSPGGQGMAVASTKCTAPNTGSLQVLAGAR